MNQQNSNEIVQSNTDTETVCEDISATNEVTDITEATSVVSVTEVTEAKADNSSKKSKSKAPLIWGIASIAPSVINILLTIGDLIFGFLFGQLLPIDLPLYIIPCLILSIAGIVISIIAFRKKAPKAFPIIGIILAPLTMIPPIIDVILTGIFFIIDTIFGIIIAVEGLAAIVVFLAEAILAVLAAIVSIVTALATIFTSLAAIAGFFESIMSFIESFSDSITTVAAIL